MIHIRLVRPLSPYLAVLSIAFLAGCLPSSCNKSESRAIMPADSLSREYAASVGEDTLRSFQHPTRLDSLVYPRTLLVGPSGKLFVSDGETGQIWTSGSVMVGATDSSQTKLELHLDNTTLSAPYLAGFVGDTLIVFSAGTNEIALVLGGTIVDQFGLEAIDATATLRYAGVEANKIVIKSLDPENGAHMAWYSSSGVRIHQEPLFGEYWRHSGLLKSDGDSLLSLRGFLPHVDVFHKTAKIDSVGLFGFDSPMLARTRSFEYGGVKAPPLISASASSCGGSWYLLNVRPGWIRIDVYDRTGHLQAAYIQPDPTFNRDLLTTDIAVWCNGPRTPIVAVSVVKPEPEIRWFVLPD